MSRIPKVHMPKFGRFTLDSSVVAVDDDGHMSMLRCDNGGHVVLSDADVTRIVKALLEALSK